MQQLETVFTAQRAVAALDAQIREKKDATNQIVKRVRENLSAEGCSEEHSLVKGYTAELNMQEDTLAMFLRDLAGLQQQRQAANSDLNNEIEALTPNEKIDS